MLICIVATDIVFLRRTFRQSLLHRSPKSSKSGHMEVEKTVVRNKPRISWKEHRNPTTYYVQQCKIYHKWKWFKYNSFGFLLPLEPLERWRNPQEKEIIEPLSLSKTEISGVMLAVNQPPNMIQAFRFFKKIILQRKKLICSSIIQTDTVGFPNSSFATEVQLSWAIYSFNYFVSYKQRQHPHLHCIE